MKNVIKRVSLSVLFLALFTDCNKELELRPLGQLDENTFYQSEADFEAASLSPYSTLLGIYWSQDGNGNFNTVLMPDDDMVPGGTGADAQEDFNWTASNGQFSFVWGECYKGIQRANVIIDRLPDAKKFKDEVKKARFEAEAKFLRAYFHFQLALHFGTPPVSTSTISTVEESRKPNSKPGEIWDLVISDLQFAKQNLPESYDASNLGRVTKWAATALLGKVYLYRAQWDKNDALYANAATEFSAVVASGKFSLVPKYADNFAENTENNAESIFEIQMSRGDFNPWLATDFGLDGDQNVGSAGTARLILFRPSCGPTNVCEPGGSGGLGYGRAHVSKPLQDEFEVGDPRRPETIFLEGDDFNGAPYQAAWSITGSTPAKYVKQENLEFRFPLNISTDNERVIRYSDVLLMLAEAKLLGSNDITGAATLVNLVRRRADPSGVILADRSGAVSKDQLFKWLMHERRIELAFEGHRYNDLVRWHRATLINIKTDINFGRATANTSWDPKHLIKPIPQRDRDLDANLQQNPGY